MIGMAPYIKTFLNSFNSGTDNSFWRVGGYQYELTNQMHYLGNWFECLLAVTLIVGLIIRGSRIYTVFAILHGVSTLVLFHKQVTLVAYNHSMTMIPFYFLCEMILLYLFAVIANKYCKIVFGTGVVALSGLNMFFACVNEDNYSEKFSCISLVMPRAQVDEIKEVADWLEDNCEEEDTVYFIPHGFPYNPDVFRYINMPNRFLMNKMSYGSAVLGTHSFPTSMLDARYVMTSDPFCEYSVANEYNDAFLQYCDVSGKYQVAQVFDMGDGYTVTIYHKVSVLVGIYKLM